MPRTISEFQQRFWTPERLAILYRRWQSYDASEHIAAQVNAVPGGEPVTVHDCQQMAAFHRIKRPYGYGSIHRARTVMAGKPNADVQILALIKTARLAALVHQAEDRQRKQATSTAIATAKAIQEAKIQKAANVRSMQSTSRKPLDMGKPPTRPFSMLAMSIPDPTVARRLRDMRHARDGSVNHSFSTRKTDTDEE